MYFHSFCLRNIYSLHQRKVYTCVQAKYSKSQLAVLQHSPILVSIQAVNLWSNTIAMHYLFKTSFNDLETPSVPPK